MSESIKENRVDQINYYLDIAETVLERSTCLKRHYGAVIVKNNEIISTGYNGAPRGISNCIDKNKPPKNTNNFAKQFNKTLEQYYEVHCTTKYENGGRKNVRIYKRK